MVITLLVAARPGARLLPISAFFCTFGRSFRLEYAAKIVRYYDNAKYFRKKIRYEGSFSRKTRYYVRKDKVVS